MVVEQAKKDRYRKLCEQRQDIPLFMQAWWLDAVCDNKNWCVLFYEKNENVIGTLVYFYDFRYGFKLIIQPQLTQLSGLWIDYPENLTPYETLSFEKVVMFNLINQLNELNFSYYDQNFQPTLTNWLPFYWKGFSQTTRYTYQIEDISDTEKCYQHFSYAKKKQISKAMKNLSIDFELSGEIFYDELSQNLRVLDKKVHYSKELFLKLYTECKSRNQGCIIAVRDHESKIHAANFIVWDTNCSYNLVSTINQEFRSSGGSSLVVWEAIKQMSAKTKVFDFEGSMNENIENSFRQFGSIQKPYFRIRKYNSFLFKILLHLRKWK